MVAFATMPGDEPDFRALVAAFGPPIRRYLVRLVGDGEADDLLQEVFTRAHRSMGTRRGDSRVSTWLYRIATNAAIDRLRRPGSRREIPLAGLSVVEGQKVPEAACDCAESRPDFHVMSSEMRGCITSIVGRLPHAHRDVIILSEFRDLSDQEVADTLGIKLEAAKIRLHRARKKLKALMEQSCRLYRDERNELACEPRSRSGA